MKESLHIYIRVSTSIQEEEGTSLKTQKETGIELSKKLGMTYQIHDEGGSSSSKDTLDNHPVLLNILIPDLKEIVGFCDEECLEKTTERNKIGFKIGSV